jgi:hydroxylaminobenzene mutase
MYDREKRQSQGQSLIQLGVVLLLFGLPAALVVLGRMPVTTEMVDHSDACINGFFLIMLGLLWSHLKLINPWRSLVYRLTLYGTLIKWTGLLSLVWWMSREEAQIRSSALSMAFLLRDVLFSLGWFMLVVFLIVVCLVAANAAHRFRMQRPGHIQERQPPIG